jgi:hypothetical protein
MLLMPIVIIVGVVIQLLCLLLLRLLLHVMCSARVILLALQLRLW